MIRDLRTILDGWEYEPGKISCRRIMGRDGREKIQTRIDLGVIQLECTGRPDGQRPEGYESLLEYQEQRLREHIGVHGNDEEFVLAPEDCRELRHEAYLYYQRYLALYVLEDFDAVARDTARNLRVMALCERYAAAPEDRTLLRPQWAYVLMMHARGRAQAALAAADQTSALAAVDQGLAEILRFAATVEEGTCERELSALRGMRDEILEQLPPDAPSRLQAQLEAALAVEDYEGAARLRDRLRGARGASAAPAS